MQRRCCWPPERLSALAFRRSLTSSQSAACSSALLDPLVEIVGHPEDARAEGDVVVDRLREGVRLLEDHADPLPHLDRVDVSAVEILAVVEDLAFDHRARDQVVQVVEAADERALAAARGPDEGRDEVPVDLERDVLQRLVAVVGDAEVPDVEEDLAGLLGRELLLPLGHVHTHVGHCDGHCAPSSDTAESLGREHQARVRPNEPGL